MTLISRAQYDRLAAVEGKPCITIYLPTHQKGVEMLEGRDSKVFKSLINDAKHRLEKEGIERQQADKLFAQAIQLQDDKDFWRHQMKGLAVYISEGEISFLRLPVELEQEMHIGNSFYLKPLIPALFNNDNFYLITLSQNAVKFFYGNSVSLTELDVSEFIPESMEEALGKDDVEVILNYHSMNYRGSGSNKTSNEGIFQGHGTGEVFVERELRKYFAMIDKGLSGLLNGNNVPMVFGGVDYLFPIFKEVNSYGSLIDEPIKGNLDRLTLNELHKKAYPLVTKNTDNGLEKACAAYHKLAGTTKVATVLDDVIYKAFIGAVDALFVHKDYEQWGRFDPEKNTAEISENRNTEDEPLVEFAIRHTIEKGGKVFLLDPQEMPDSAHEIIAMLRM